MKGGNKESEEKLTSTDINLSSINDSNSENEYDMFYIN
jgi:hypothetical protein